MVGRWSEMGGRGKAGEEEVCVKGGTEGWGSKVRREGDEGTRKEMEGNLGRRGRNEGRGGASRRAR